MPPRGVLANVTVLPELVKLAEVVVASSGVTIVVVVVVVVAAAVVLSEDKPKEEVAEAIKRWPKKVEEKCQPRYDECFDNPKQPDTNRKFGTEKPCLFCLWECRKDNGIWPNYKCPPPGWKPN